MGSLQHLKTGRTKMAKKYSIIGIDGNAFCIMGYVCTAMAREAHHLGWNGDELAKQKKAYMDDAMSSDYDHLVAISDKMIGRINEAMGGDENED